MTEAQAGGGPGSRDSSRLSGDPARPHPAEGAACTDARTADRWAPLGFRVALAACAHVDLGCALGSPRRRKSELIQPPITWSFKALGEEISLGIELLD